MLDAAAADVSVDAAGVTDAALVVVVSRRAGPDVLRTVEAAVQSEPPSDGLKRADTVLPGNDASRDEHVDRREWPFEPRDPDCVLRLPWATTSDPPHLGHARGWVHVDVMARGSTIGL